MYIYNFYNIFIIFHNIYDPEKLSTLRNRFIYTMKKTNFGYSMNNIGISQNKTYLLQLIEKIEMVIKRMGWKSLCNSKKETNGIKTEWHGLKSSNISKQVKDLIPLENDLIALVQNIRVRKTKNHLQKKYKKTFSQLDHQIRQSLLPIKQQTFKD